MPVADAGIGGMPTLDLILLWIATQPVWLGATIVVVPALLLSLVGAYFAARLVDTPAIASPQDLLQENLVGMAKYQFLAEVFAALLAFMLINEAIRYTDARRHVQSETTSIRLFDSALAQMTQPEAVELRRALRTYVRNVVDVEFLTMQAGLESPAARKNMRQIVGAYIQLEIPAGPDEIARLQADQFLANMLDSRHDRLSAVNPNQRTLIWIIFLVNTAIALLFTWFFGSRSPGAHALMSMLLAGAQSILIYMIIVLSHPFTGPLAISPRAYEYLLNIQV